MKPSLGRFPARVDTFGMSDALLRNLKAIYGDQAEGLLTRIEAVVRKYAPQVAEKLGGPGRGSLSQRDSILITYADQVLRDSTPPLRTLAAFLEQHVNETVSSVHILPFYPASSDDGFAVKDYYLVDPSFGDWAEIRRLGASYDLMFDAVFNHLSSESGWFRGFLADDPAYRDFFIVVEGEPDLSRVVRPRALPLLTEFRSAQGPFKVWTTFSADQVDLNFKNLEVFLATLDALLFYVSQGARFIRLDAIAFLWKEIGTPCLHAEQTHLIIQCLRAVLDRIAPKVGLITETNVPHADNISYFGNGLNEAQLVYNFALPPLVLHSLATGNSERLNGWVQSLPPPSETVTFLNFLASHDGIGLNPVRGILTDDEIQALVDRAIAHGGFVSEKTLPNGTRAPYELNINYFDALSSPFGAELLRVQVARFLAAHAVMLVIPGVPGIYFHSLFGSRGDRASARATGLARRINREKLQRDALETELSDPSSIRASVLRGMVHLLRVRQAHAAFSPEAGCEVLRFAPQIFAVIRAKADEVVLCCHNLSGESVEVTLPRTHGAADESWHLILTLNPSDPKRELSRNVILQPYEVLWLICDRSGRPSQPNSRCEQSRRIPC